MIENQFRDFSLAALDIGASMLQTLTPEQQHAVDGAIQAGARLSLEFGPLPQFESLQLLLIEREGARHNIASISINKGSLQ